MTIFFFAILDISPLQQARPSNVLREVKTSVSFYASLQKELLLVELYRN